ncbi:Transposable element Tc3 transposase [Anthophora retusa]
MPRGKYLTEEERGKILVMKEVDFSIREIARRLGKSHKVVINFLRDQANYGKNKMGGPMKKLSPRTERLIVKTASNTLKSCNQIKKELNLDVSRWTIHRVLQENRNIVREKLMSAPKLLPRHKIARLEYARANMHRNWHNVSQC